MSAIDINTMVLSIYNAVINLLSSVTEMVGLECSWCRALPYKNSEDVVLQEYTLTNVECPRSIKVVTSNTEYNAGQFNVDLWGITYELPFEINIDLATWQSVYDLYSLPLKGDIVLIPIYNRIFEVSSASTIHTINESITGYKCQLKKYNPMASRKESDDLRLSIDELTVSLEKLFGDTISREAADAAIYQETGYNNTTNVDPMKDYDIDSIIDATWRGVNNVVFTEAQYSFLYANKNITYNISANYDINDTYNHWIYTCWFKLYGENTFDGIFNFKGIYKKEKNYWYFYFSAEMNINEPVEVTIFRGNLLKMDASIVYKEDDDTSTFVLRIKTSEILKANKKITNWWNSGIWKIQQNIHKTNYNLLTGYYSDNKIFNLSIDSSTIYININNVEKHITYSTNIDSNNDWNYIAFDISPTNIRIVLVELCININKPNSLNNELYGTYEKIVYNDTINISLNSFSIDKFTIENMGLSFYQCNIRLYENEYPLEDNYKIDMYSIVTKNANKLILVDTPKVPNKMTFVSPMK